MFFREFRAENVRQFLQESFFCFPWFLKKSGKIIWFGKLMKAKRFSEGTSKWITGKFLQETEFQGESLMMFLEAFLKNLAEEFLREFPEEQLNK